MFANMITIPANLTFDKNGKKKTSKNTFPTGWKKTKQSIVNDTVKHKAVLTGKINNITVIDFDTPKDNELDAIEFFHSNYDLFKQTFIEQSVSGKGFHVYYKYNPLLKSITRAHGANGLSIDILGDDGNKNPNCCILGKPINNVEIIEMPQEVIDLLTNGKKLNVEDVEGEDVEDNVDNVDNVEDVEDVEEVELEDLEKVKSLVEILTVKESDDRTIWISIGRCLYNILEDKKEAFNIWDKFSRLSNKYDASEINEEWESFRPSKMSIGTIIYHCKKYKIKFNLWKKENKKGKKIDLSAVYKKHNAGKNIFTLTNSEYTDLDIAEWFISEYKDQFIYYDNKLFVYNGKVWEKHNDKTNIFNILSTLYQKLKPIYEDLQIEINKVDDVDDTISAFVSACEKNCKRALSTTSGCNSARDFIINRITTNTNLFDLNENLVCFSNGTYDLDLGVFRESSPLDYSTLSTHYDYHISSAQDKAMVFEYLNKIMSCPQKLNTLLLALCSGLRGVTFEKFIVLTGEGRNSKDTLITYIMKAVLGNYYYLGNTASITNIIKEGVSVGLSNLENKRFVVFNEPAKNETIKISTVKYISGTDCLNTRGLYSSKTDIPICPSMFMLCNDIPKLDHVDNAIKDRLVIISFDSLFKEADYFVEHDIEVGHNNIYLGDDSVKHKGFLSKMKLPFMNILLEYFKIFKGNGFKLGTLPDSIKNENNKYLINSDEFTCWLNSSYVKTKSKENIMKLKDLYKDYKSSDLYDNLTKKEKRECNYDVFQAKIKKNPNLRAFYHERKTVNGKDYRNILTNYTHNTGEVDGNEDSGDSFTHLTLE